MLAPFSIYAVHSPYGCCSYLFLSLWNKFALHINHLSHDPHLGPLSALLPWLRTPCSVRLTVRLRSHRPRRRAFFPFPWLLARLPCSPPTWDTLLFFYGHVVLRYIASLSADSRNQYIVYMITLLGHIKSSLPFGTPHLRANRPRTILSLLPFGTLSLSLQSSDAEPSKYVSTQIAFMPMTFLYL